MSALICNYIYYKVWDEITYPTPTSNGCADEDWECINNLITQLIMGMIN